ncbi:MAG: hypothetical protein GY711_01150 [bacterium]|nr:hypothetical protein [bacterium]
MRTKYSLLSGLAAFAFASTAQAQFWTDGFEGYSAGSALEGQGGWHGWDGIDTAFAQVSTLQARSGSNSVVMQIGADSVQEWTGPSTGKWVVLGYVYVPGAYDGNFSYMIMNAYTNGGPYEWGSWVEFDGPTNTLICNCGGTSAATVVLQTDRWVELRKEIDLTANTAEIFYDGASLASYVWTDGWNGTSSHAVPDIQAIDLFPDPAVGTGAVFVDDLALYEVPDTLGVNYCGPAIPNSTTFPGEISASGNLAASANDVTLTATQLPPGQFGYFLAGQTPGFFNPPNSNGFICLAGNIGRYNTVPDIIQGPTGSISIDTTAVPVNPPQGIISGETWLFQCWYRDGVTSNFTDGLEITFL